MPSWNIHIAHCERVLAHKGVIAGAVRDRNAFLFGCLLPDIYVGYMVPDIREPIPYRTTHFAEPSHIPKPHEERFWTDYVVPRARRLKIDPSSAACSADEIIGPSSIKLERDYINRFHHPWRYVDAPSAADQTSPLDVVLDDASIERSVFDMVLGTWLHLFADHIWNTRVNEFLDAHGGKPNEEFRIKKQRDFALFGCALPIESIPRPTPRLIKTAAAFPQYPIEERPLLYAIAVAHEIVRTNADDGDPRYQMLTSDFFEHVFRESVESADELARERLLNL